MTKMAVLYIFPIGICLHVVMALVFFAQGARFLGILVCAFLFYYY